MSIRKWLAALVCCALAIIATPNGASLCASAESMEGSRLIGLYMTTHDLSSLVGDDGVVWAVTRQGTNTDETEYCFDGARGLRFICDIDEDENGESSIVSNVDDGICQADFQFEDERTVEMRGTILFVPGAEETCFFYNPVMKSQDGRVFVMPGEPMVVDASMSQPGAAVGQTLRDERRHVVNGAEITDVTVVSLEIQAVRAPVQVTLLQFNEAHELLKADTYAPDAVPEELVLLKEADYLLVETRERTAEGAFYSRRAVFGREEDYLNTLFCREDGICQQRYHEIIWTGEE